jgi:hypothetical protein
VNEYGYRGDPVPPADSYATRNIVVLGDSFTFGQGVSDGEPYPAVLEELLGDNYEVINLGSPGWGLTQEIRRYYEFGALYQPEVVVLQYCWNDPEDNLNHRVTVIEGDDFRFQNSSNSTNWAKKYLSGSPIQKSQLYNFYRGRVYEWFQNRHVRRVAAEMSETPGPAAAGGVSPQQEYYCELLDLFAEKLEEDGVRLIVISVEDQMSNFPYIAEHIQSLHDTRRIVYVDLDAAFANVERGEGFYSPEGHWGPRAHRLVAESLATAVEDGASE